MGNGTTAFAQTISVQCSTLEPLLLRPQGLGVSTVREVAGARIDRVVIGGEADWPDLKRFAATLEGRALAPDVRVLLQITSRPLREAAVRSGLLARLRAVGVEITDEISPAFPLHPEGGMVAYGLDPSEVSGGRGGEGRGDRAPFYVAGPDTCAAAAVAGVITDVRRLDPPRIELGAAPAPLGVADELGEPVEALLVRAPTSGPPQALAPSDRRYPLGAPIAAGMRGLVRCTLGDGVTVEGILPWGARARPHHARIHELARFALPGATNGKPASARLEEGGFVVAGRGYGGGEPRTQAAAVIVQLGIRAILARSFDRRHRDQLVMHGVLPLRLRSDADHAELATGDELEIPDLPEGLETGKPLVLRDLTRGSQLALDHDLEPREVELVRAGGLLRLLRQALLAA
jgi:aconitate hydratase